MYEVFTKQNGKLIPVKLLELWTNHDGNQLVDVEAILDVKAFESSRQPYRGRFTTVEASSLVVIRKGEG